MKTSCVILDFDGTLTNVNAEAAEFVEGYQAELAAEFGSAIDQDWSEIAAEINDSPARFGWEIDGKLVAPAHSDPYIFCGALAREMLRRRRPNAPDSEHQAVLDRLFRTLYGSKKPCFRDDAKGVVGKLLDTGLPIYVVTNSDQTAVSQKIASWAPEFSSRLRLQGNAKKYALLPSEDYAEKFAEVPDTIELAGYGRPIQMKRGRYFDTLQTILAEHQIPPEELLICGDIFEMDLAMPAHLGIQVQLIVGKNTKQFEIDAAKSTPGGDASSELAALLTRVLAPAIEAIRWLLAAISKHSDGVGPPDLRSPALTRPRVN